MPLWKQIWKNLFIWILKVAFLGICTCKYWSKTGAFRTFKKFHRRVRVEIKWIKVPYIRHFLCIYRLLCYQIDTNNIESMFLMRNWMCILYLNFSLWCNYFCDSCTSSLLTIGLLLVLLCSDFSDVRLFFKRYYVIIYAGIQSPIHFCLV